MTSSRLQVSAEECRIVAGRRGLGNRWMHDLVLRNDAGSIPDGETATGYAS